VRSTSARGLVWLHSKGLRIYFLISNFANKNRVWFKNTIPWYVDLLRRIQGYLSLFRQIGVSEDCNNNQKDLYGFNAVTYSALVKLSKMLREICLVFELKMKTTGLIRRHMITPQTQQSIIS